MSPQRLLILVALLAGGPAGAQVVCPRAAAPPVLDGRLDDACWKTAAAIRGFTRPEDTDPPDKRVEARACFDDRALYLAFLCEEPRLDRLVTAAQPGSENVWQDDCVEIWFRGAGSSDSDQLIANAAGVRQAVRRRQGGVRPWSPNWQVKAGRGPQQWILEMRIPFADLGVTPARGGMLPLKLGREDHAGGGERLATWPPASRYATVEDCGSLYFEDSNLLRDAAMAGTLAGKERAWSFGKGDAGLFSSVTDGGAPAIRFDTPGRYAAASQSLRLKPNAYYRLEARVRGDAGAYLRARVVLEPGKPNRPFDATVKPSEGYVPLQLTFPTGPDGEALLILGATEATGKGAVFIAGLRVSEEVSVEADGPAIPVAADAADPLRVTKLPVADCRALRGFIAAPVDGKLDSFGWNGETWEYNQGEAGSGVGYAYHQNDGLHITLADAGPVNAVLIRGGARVKLYGAGAAFDGPGKAPLICSFRGHTRVSRALLARPASGGRFRFFGLEDGTLSDVSFFRLAQGPGDLPAPEAWHVAAPAGTAAPAYPFHFTGEPPALAAPDPQPFLKARFPADEQAQQGLAPGAGGEPVSVPAKKAVHWVSAPLPAETPLAAIGLDFRVADLPPGAGFTVRVQDPLNPRAELMGADFALSKPGRVRLILDFPDQVVPAGACLWLTLSFDAAAKLSGPDGGAPAVQLYRIPRARALSQAVAYRKLALKGLFCELSEPRPWTSLGRRADVERWLRDEDLGTRLRELFETLYQCKALAPEDDTVRQYDEWIFGRQRELPKPEPRIESVPGAPEWAVVARQAWLLARAVPEWWIRNRMVPTGEFGGEVGDDTDMYQNYSDFPVFEDSGVGAMIKDGAARLAELAEKQNLSHGLNRHTMDPLHAYEEGINHESLMSWWFYGDPVYVERCMVAARSLEALTVVTPRGHRHFKSQSCGAEDLAINRPTDKDGDCHPLLLHPAFEVAWYNRNPRALKLLRAWGDTWLEHIGPREGATEVEVATEKGGRMTTQPLSGGYGAQALAFAYLAEITRDPKYLQPFLPSWMPPRSTEYVERYLPEFLHLDLLPDLGKEFRFWLRDRGAADLAGNGRKESLVAALKGDIAHLQHFPAMYTTAEPFTDRVFLTAISNAALAYTGGYTTRNKFNHPHAASYEGFGTDYAALVMKGGLDTFHALLYNFAGRPLKGRIRFWTLQHGRYRVTFGPDTNGDDKADSVTLDKTLEVQRATPLALILPPRQVMVLELRRVQKLDDELQRADLALSPREVTVKGDTVQGVAHNIGAVPATCEVALVNPAGKVVVRKSLGNLPAPVDLQPQRRPFSLAGLPAKHAGWKVVLNPGGKVPETYTENNAVTLP